MKSLLFSFLFLCIAATSAFADSDSIVQVGWSCDVKTGPAGSEEVAHLDLFADRPVYPKIVDQKIDGSNYVRFEVSSFPANGQASGELLVSVMKRHLAFSDERVATTITNYYGPAIDNSDALISMNSHLFLVVNPSNVQIQCKPKFR